jgi:hypothetical protein
MIIGNWGRRFPTETLEHLIETRLVLAASVCVFARSLSVLFTLGLIGALHRPDVPSCSFEGGVSDEIELTGRLVDAVLDAGHWEAPVSDNDAPAATRTQGFITGLARCLDA